MKGQDDDFPALGGSDMSKKKGKDDKKKKNTKVALNDFLAGGQSGSSEAQKPASWADEEPVQKPSGTVIPLGIFVRVVQGTGRREVALSANLGLIYSLPALETDVMLSASDFVGLSRCIKIGGFGGGYDGGERYPSRDSLPTEPVSVEC